METELKIGDLVAFKADKEMKLVVTGVGKDGYVLLRYYDKATSEFLVKAPSKYKVVSNGLLQEEKEFNLKIRRFENLKIL